MTDTVAKIAAKGCNATGITEELATRLHDQLGKKLMAVVELEAAARTEKSDGNQAVQLRILSVEPATDQLAEDHLREFARALYYNRAVDEAQPTLDDGPEPTVKEVLGRGKSLLDHDDDGQVVGLWDGNTDPDDGPGTTGEELQMLGAPFPGDDPDGEDENADQERPKATIAQFTGGDTA